MSYPNHFRGENDMDASVVILVLLVGYCLLDASHCIRVGNEKRRKEARRIQLCRKLKKSIRTSPAKGGSIEKLTGDVFDSLMKF